MARGVCSSPLSSADEAEGATSSQADGLAEQEAEASGGEELKKLVHDAPQDFIEYLAEQLSAGQQAKFETEFGGGQATSWKTKRKRDELESWIRALGFTSGATLKRNALRIASLKADVILSELRQKVPLIADDKEEDAVMETNLISEGEDASPGDDGKEQDGDYASDPALIRLKKYFKKLESQKLESSMEDVLAQPSIRRDRRLARRLSKLGRISGHRLSSIALSSDAFRSGISPHAEEERAGQSVLHLVLHSGLVDVKASKEVLRKVSTMWEKTTVMAYAWTITDYSNKTRRKPTELLASGNAEFGAESQQQQTSSSDERERLFQYMRMEFCDGGDLEDFIGLQKNKLLNFFLKDIGRANLSKPQDLADYGAADSNPDNLGKPVTIDQFATLENSPIEFLLEGDAAEQSYAADTFSLGLCLLHLFTGSAPYEEILQDVHCPSELLKDLKALWTKPSENKGLDKVWQLLLKHLRPEDPAIKHPQRRSRRTAGADKAQLHTKTTKDQFDHDQSLYSIASGSNDIIYRCREGLKTTPGAMDLLTQLVDFDPSQRPTLKQ
ncbi:Protein kinase-like domain [Phytophthora cactorum]|nr:Protein kinase-like domain [Phytophthora cactorum]